MKTPFSVCLVGLVAAGLLSPAPPLLAGPRPNTLFYYEDMDSGAPGWTHEDLTVGVEAKFHIDTYYAFDDPDVEEDHSWWCGELNPAFTGGDGYGNSWDQRLELPPIDIGYVAVRDASWGRIKGMYRDGVPQETPSRDRPTIHPILTFAYRYDSEPGYDYTYVQVDSLGVWRSLNAGYHGTSGGWQDHGPYGYDLSNCLWGDELRLRFRFISDGAWSDEDGLHDTDGGAFHADNIQVYDFLTGTVLFYEDCEEEPACVATVPEPAGDYWHLVEDLCSSYSDPYSWWCGDDADTSLIPPNLVNALYSPVISIAGAGTCTLRHAVHAEVPTVDNDYWTEKVSLDGGTTWHTTHAWWGDFAGCDGWGSSGFAGDNLTAYLGEGTDFVFQITFYTTDNGCGPGAAGGAGINLDDVWLEGQMM